MSKMMLKMLADMAGITPEQITDNIEQFRQTAINGVELLNQINNRLSAIENHLGIEGPVIEKGNSDGEEIRIGEPTS